MIDNSPFLKYPHLERIDRPEVCGLLNGLVHVFPKIDGTNACVWSDASEVTRCGSRNREILEGSDNHGFREWLFGPGGEAVRSLVTLYPDWILYGEWLVPHSFRGYIPSAWRRFYVFDVFSRARGRLLPFSEWLEAVMSFGVDYVPLLDVLENPTREQLEKVAKGNRFLLSAGEAGGGEGIVCKRYDFANRYARTTWGKIVLAEYLEAKRAQKREPAGPVEERLAGLVTSALIDKEMARLGEPLNVAAVMGCVYHAFVTEELWAALKKCKDPKVDFRALRRLIEDRVRARVLL